MSQRRLKSARDIPCLREGRRAGLRQCHGGPHHLSEPPLRARHFWDVTEEKRGGGGLARVGGHLAGTLREPPRLRDPRRPGSEHPIRQPRPAGRQPGIAGRHVRTQLRHSGTPTALPRRPGAGNRHRHAPNRHRAGCLRPMVVEPGGAARRRRRSATGRWSFAPTLPRSGWPPRPSRRSSGCCGRCSNCRSANGGWSPTRSTTASPSSLPARSTGFRPSARRSPATPPRHGRTSIRPPGCWPGPSTRRGG